MYLGVLFYLTLGCLDVLSVYPAQLDEEYYMRKNIRSSEEVRQELFRKARDQGSQVRRKPLSEKAEEIGIVKIVLCILILVTLILSFTPGVQSFEGAPAVYRYVAATAAVMIAVLVCIDNTCD